MPAGLAGFFLGRLDVSLKVFPNVWKSPDAPTRTFTPTGGETAGYIPYVSQWEPGRETGISHTEYGEPHLFIGSDADHDREAWNGAENLFRFIGDSASNFGSQETDFTYRQMWRIESPDYHLREGIQLDFEFVGTVSKSLKSSASEARFRFEIGSTQIDFTGLNPPPALSGAEGSLFRFVMIVDTDGASGTFRLYWWNEQGTFTDAGSGSGSFDSTATGRFIRGHMAVDDTTGGAGRASWTGHQKLAHFG